MNHKPLSIFWIPILIILAFTACKSRSKRTALPAHESTVQSERMLVQSLITKNESWTEFNTKLKLDVKENNNSVSAKASLRMYKDSCIWISASFLGFEAARILITRDSFYLLDKFNKRAYIAPIQNMAIQYLGFEAELSYLQNIILGTLILPPNTYHFSQSQAQNAFALESQKGKLIIEQIFRATSMPSQSHISQMKSNDALKITYSEKYHDLTPFSVPQKIEMHAQMASYQKDFSVKAELSQAEFPPSQSYPFQISSSYEIIRE